MENANKEKFELVMIDDIPALFTCLRIDRNSIPEGLFGYDVRHDDSGQGIACEIAPFVLVNHWGTVITKQEIPLENKSYFPKDDINYLGLNMTLKDFVQADVDQIIAKELTAGMPDLNTAPQMNM